MYIAQRLSADQPTTPGVKYPAPVQLWTSELERPTGGRGRENGVYYAMQNGFFKSLMQALPGFQGSDIDSPGALKDANAIAWYEGMRQNFKSLDELLKTGGTLIAALGPPTGPPPSGGTAGTFPGFKAAVQKLEQVLTGLQNKQAEMDAAAQAQKAAQAAPQPAPLATPPPVAPFFVGPPMRTLQPIPPRQPAPVAQAGMVNDISPLAIGGLILLPLVVQFMLRR